MSDKGTIYNGLTQLFSQNNTKKPNDVVISTDNKEEFLIKKLEKQQSYYLDTQSGKLRSYINQHNITHQSARLAAYADFEQMEYYPVLARALDLYAEEATTKDMDGKVLTVFSESARVQSILEDLFYNRLHIQTNLAAWTRNMCKYGDNMVFLNLKDKEGVIGCQQLPNNEIERVDGGLYSSDGKHQQKMTKFTYKTAGTELMEWQVAHFRLLFDDRRIPYGVSMLEKARRTWRNLLIAEDAMLTYRVVRAPERRVFKIFVGNMNSTDVEPYINKIMDKIKRRPTVGQNGNYGSKYNVMSIDDDYVIPIRSDANESSVETLAGASNMGDIADIEYIEKQLFTCLGIPAQYLNYGSESTGGNEGKNLSSMDIRFARTIGRVQEAALATLNKIATTHLFMLGLGDEIGNFTLALNNPSTQSEIMRVEYLTSLMTLYREATTKNDTGFSPYSNLMAMRKILNLSDNEIIQNIEEQRLEKAAATELENTANIIKKSGLFDRVDKVYGVPDIQGDVEDVGDGDISTDIGDGGGESFTSQMDDVGGDELLGESITKYLNTKVKKKKDSSVPKYSKYLNILNENKDNEFKKSINLNESMKKMLDELKEIKNEYDS